MAEVFNLSWDGSGRIQFSCNYNCLHAWGKMTKKDRNKNRHSPYFQSLRQFKKLDQMPGFELQTAPPPRRYISLVLSIEVPNRICDCLFLLLLFSVDGIYRRVTLQKSTI